MKKYWLLVIMLMTQCLFANNQLLYLTNPNTSLSCEKEIPCTPKWAGREDLYPELINPGEKSVQEKFKFGYFKKLYDQLGEAVWRDTSIRHHQPGVVLGKHIDGPDVQRLHIPVDSDPNALFLYGENLER